MMDEVVHSSQIFYPRIEEKANKKPSDSKTVRQLTKVTEVLTSLKLKGAKIDNRSLQVVPR